MKAKTVSVNLPFWVGDTVYKICPVCKPEHKGSCNGCLWRDNSSGHGCDVGIRIYPDGSTGTSSMPDKKQIIEKQVTETSFFTMLHWWNILYFPSKDDAAEMIKEFNGIINDVDKENRYRAYKEMIKKKRMEVKKEMLMKRTKENCGVIKRCVKWRIGEPKTMKDGKCEGYRNNDGEPIRECKKCILCFFKEDAKE